MRPSAERLLLVLACLCMAGAAIGLFIQYAPKPKTAAVQETAAPKPAAQETVAQEQEPEDEPRRFPLPAGPRKFQ